MFRLPKMRVKQFRWAQLESAPRNLLYTLSPTWGRFSNLEIIGLGKKIKRYRRIFTSGGHLKEVFLDSNQLLFYDYTRPNPPQKKSTRPKNRIFKSRNFHPTDLRGLIIPLTQIFE